MTPSLGPKNFESATEKEQRQPERDLSNMFDIPNELLSEKSDKLDTELCVGNCKSKVQDILEQAEAEAADDADPEEIKQKKIKALNQLDRSIEEIYEHAEPAKVDEKVCYFTKKAIKSARDKLEDTRPKNIQLKKERAAKEPPRNGRSTKRGMKQSA